MIPLEVTAAERRALIRTLAGTHRMRLRVQVRDRDEKVVGSLTASGEHVISGEVQIDATADIARQLNLVVLDPKRRLRFVPDQPAEAALFADNFVSVRRGAWVPSLEKWIDVPVFWGPATLLRRSGDEVTVEAMGKETLLQEPHLIFRTMRIPKGTKVTDAIRELASAAGETLFDIPDLTGDLPKALVVTRHEAVWPRLKRLARTIDRDLFYDGRGRLRLRKRPERVSFEFDTAERDGAGTVTSDPEVSYDMTKARNTVVVLGPKPEGKGARRIRAVSTAPRSHPLSPWRLARNGVPRRMVEIVELDHVKRVSKARSTAERTLRSLLLVEGEVSFQALALPLLEERDLVALRTEDWRVAFRVQQVTMPLSPGDAMSIGTLRRLIRTRRG